MIEAIQSDTTNPASREPASAADYGGYATAFRGTDDLPADAKRGCELARQLLPQLRSDCGPEILATITLDLIEGGNAALDMGVVSAFVSEVVRGLRRAP